MAAKLMRCFAGPHAGRKRAATRRGKSLYSTWDRNVPMGNETELCRRLGGAVPWHQSHQHEAERTDTKHTSDTRTAITARPRTAASHLEARECMELHA